MPDPDQANNTASDTDSVDSIADLSITKTDGVTSVVAGTNTTYTVTITNDGPSSVTGADVVDPLPAGVTFVSATGGATHDAGTNTVHYTTGTIAAGGSESFTITVAIEPSVTGSITNTATVSPPTGTTDPTPADNTATDTDAITLGRRPRRHEDGRQLDLHPGHAGHLHHHRPQRRAFHGPLARSHRHRAGRPPQPWSFGAPSAGSYDAATGVWSGLNLAAGQSVTITLSGTPDPAMTGNLVNTATVSAPVPERPTRTPRNDTATDTDTPNPVADLAITKTDGRSTYTPGSARHLHDHSRQPRPVERHREHDRRRHPSGTDGRELDIEPPPATHRSAPARPARATASQRPSISRPGPATASSSP